MQKNSYKNTKFLVFLVLILTFSIFFIQNVGLSFAANNLFTEKIEFNSSAKSAILIDAESKRVLYSKNENEKLPMASTTKIVTAITVLENCDDIEREIIIDKESTGIYGTSIYLEEGEHITIKELLYGLMLRSGNDASVALAKAVAGSVENFCGLMNDLALKVGAKNSHFSNTHGLDADDHYTTASDLALITAYALENPVFAEIVKTQGIRIQETEPKSRYLVNKNKLLKKLDGCIGVKTGFTNNAGRCLVSACERNGLKLVAVVLNCGPMFEESEKMFELAFADFQKVEILPPYFYVKSLNVSNGTDDFVGVCSKQGFSLVLSLNELKNIDVSFDVPKTLQAPIKKDEEVGEVKIYYQKQLLFSEKIYTIKDVDSVLLKDKIKDILKNWNA